jgi:hypothetical protein
MAQELHRLLLTAYCYPHAARPYRAAQNHVHDHATDELALHCVLLGGDFTRATMPQDNGARRVSAAPGTGAAFRDHALSGLAIQLINGIAGKIQPSPATT